MPKKNVVGHHLIMMNVNLTNTGTYVCNGTDQVTGENFEVKSKLFVGSKH